jgi:hypothetical protein
MMEQARVALLDRFKGHNKRGIFVDDPNGFNCHVFEAMNSLLDDIDNDDLSRSLKAPKCRYASTFVTSMPHFINAKSTSRQSLILMLMYTFSRFIEK